MIGLMNVTAGETGTAGGARAHQEDRNASAFGLARISGLQSGSIPGAEAFKVRFQLTRGHPFDQTGEFSRRKFRRCAPQPAYVIRHDRNCQDLRPILRGSFRPQVFPPYLDRARGNLFPIARYQNQMVVDRRRALWTVIGCVRHRPNLAKEGGLLHPQKRGGFRRRNP